MELQKRKWFDIETSLINISELITDIFFIIVSTVNRQYKIRS